MGERLFVIMEVEKSKEYGSFNGTERFTPVCDPHEDEHLWLKPEHVIPRSRLRYGNPDEEKEEEGSLYFSQTIDGFLWEKTKVFPSYPGKPSQRLILDPPEDPKPEELWEEWEAKHPIAPLGYANRKEWVNAMINWMADRPRGK